MATGGGLKKRVINYDGIFIGDLILCVKYGDSFGFFSFSEIQNNKSFNDTKFIYNKEQSVSFTPEVSKAMSANTSISVGSSGFSGKEVKLKGKNTLYDLFAFSSYDQPPVILKEKLKVGKYPSEDIFQILNGSKAGASSYEKNSDGTSIDKSQTKQNNYITSANIVRSNMEVINKGMFILRVAGNGFVIPLDLQNLSTQLLRMKAGSFKNVSLKASDLPRLSKSNLLEYILSREGRKQLSSGRLCYSIVPYEGNIALLKNVDINSENYVVNINESKETFTGSFSFFDGKKPCIPANFRVNDLVVGIFEKGVFTLNDRKLLLEDESNEKDYFQNYLDNYDSDDFKKRTITGFKKFFRYPKKSLYLLVMRNSVDISIFDNESTITFEIFSSGFYNTLAGYKYKTKDGKGKDTGESLPSSEYSVLKSFRENLRLEFLRFIKNNFLQNLRITAKKDSSKKKIIEYIMRVNNEIDSMKKKDSTLLGELEGSLNPKKVKEFIERQDFVYIITNLVGIKDQNKALVEFFSMPSILYGNANGQQYENLRLISYFILCSKAEYCDRIVKEPNEDSNNITFPFLLDQTELTGMNSYKMYYNQNLQMFTGNVPLP